jgi:hypothetical protein
MSTDKKIINYKGHEIWCYGVLTDEDNIEIVFDDGQDADIVDNWNYETDQPFKNWTECIKYLTDTLDITIEEMSTC